MTSAWWQTNAVALRAGGEAVLIDSPYFPDELDALPSLLAGAGFEPNGLLATHADFDHLLGRLAFPGLTLGLAESTVQRLHREPGAAQRVAARLGRPLLRQAPGPARRWGRSRACRCPDASTSAPGTGDRDRAAPGGGPHRGRDGAVRTLAGGARGRRLPLRRRDPVDLRGRLAGRLPRHAGAPGAAGGGRPRPSCPGTGRRTTATRRCACSTRTSTTSTGWSAARTRSRRAATARPSARSTRRTVSGV